MQVRYIESETEPGNTRLIIQAGGIETEIEGYGGGEYKLVLRRCRDLEGANIASQLERFQLNNPDATDAAWWGLGLVWAEPATIAHLVYDVVTGQ